METTIYIETDRLILRGWKETDHEVFAMMNSNPNVMRHFPAILDREESDRFISRITSELEEYGYGLFAVELKDSGDFIGYVGFHRFCFDVPFSPGWEIGWRLSDRHWHKGTRPKRQRHVSHTPGNGGCSSGYTPSPPFPTPLLKM